MKKGAHYVFITFSCLLFLLVSCTKEKEMLTESVSIKSVTVPTSITTVAVDGTSVITITLPKAMKTSLNPIMLSPTFDLVSAGYKISPASGTPVSFGLPTLLTPVIYTLTSPSGIQRTYSARVLFHATL